MSSDSNDNRLELALEAGGLDLWENNLTTGEITFLAQRIFGELGYTREDMGDRMDWLFSIVHPDDLPMIQAAITSYLAGNTDKYRYEFRFRAKTGEWVWYANYGKIYGEQENQRLIGVTFNINERKQSEEELRLANLQLAQQNLQLDQMNRHLNVLSSTDPLTLLPNRRHLEEQLQRITKQPKSSGALLFLDLDNFKNINDLHGHAVGDNLLCQVAGRLQTSVRSEDMVARFGGDEFVILIHFPDDQLEPLQHHIQDICQRILAELNHPYQVGELEFLSSCSIGISLFPNHGTDPEMLIQQADMALYQAKSRGRNTLLFFQPIMQQTLQYHTTLENDLRQAITGQQFELHYQVQVDNQLRPVGVEALLRWHHPTKGLLQPEQFIPIAENSGFIHSIGLWVLQTACATLARWQHLPAMKHLVMSINITAKAFHYAHFADKVLHTLAAEGIGPDKLCLELTESVMLDNVTHAVNMMNRLRAQGVQFALDDFGTGYSSLQYLKRLPVKQLKIDQYFVNDMISNTDGQAIVRAITAMANALNIEVIAEGVETEAQLHQLRECGCYHFQGFLLGRPQSEAAFINWMHQQETQREEDSSTGILSS